MKFYVFICVVSLGIASAFAMLGMWFILPFSGLELMLLGGGLYATCRKVHLQEVICINDNTLRVERGCHHPDKQFEFDRHWVQIKLEIQGYYRKKLQLFVGSHGRYEEVGAFLSDVEKETLAFELNEGILRRKFLYRA